MARHLVFEPLGPVGKVVDTFGLCSYEQPTECLVALSKMCKPDGRILLLEHGLGTWDFINRILNRNAEAHAQRWGCIYNRYHPRALPGRLEPLP
jgi:hypothetical protein